MHNDRTTEPFEKNYKSITDTNAHALVSNTLGAVSIAAESSFRLSLLCQSAFTKSLMNEHNEMRMDGLTA